MKGRISLEPVPGGELSITVEVDGQEPVTVLEVWLPERFYDDHAARDLPAGLEVDRRRSRVLVRADRSTLSEILDDARHQVFMGPELGRDYLGLVSSARATVRVLEAAGIN